MEWFHPNIVGGAHPLKPGNTHPRSTRHRETPTSHNDAVKTSLHNEGWRCHRAPSPDVRWRPLQKTHGDFHVNPTYISRVIITPLLWGYNPSYLFIRLFIGVIITSFVPGRGTDHLAGNKALKTTMMGLHCLGQRLVAQVQVPALDVVHVAFFRNFRWQGKMEFLLETDETDTIKNIKNMFIWN